MSVEEWAARVIERELGVHVSVHDDQSRPSMYDLRVGAPEGPDLAIECVSATDKVRLETWKLGPARGPLRLRLRSDWCVTIRVGARIRGLAAALESLLGNLEDRGDVELSADWRLQRSDRSTFDCLDRLGIEHMRRYHVGGTGTVHLFMDGTGGAVDSAGTSMPGWITAFLRHPDRADDRRKLQRSGARERHVFVPVALGGAPWPVESYLMFDLEYVPIAAPTLPTPIDGVWITSVFAGQGIRWDGREWRVFETRELESPPPGTGMTSEFAID